MSKPKKMKNQTKIILFVGIIGLGLFAGLWLLPYLGVYSLTPTATPTVPDSFILVGVDALDTTNTESLEDDLTYAWYGCDTDGMETEEIEDLLWADFSVADADETDFEPEDDYVYILKVSGTDICTQYWVTDSRLFEGECPLLRLGENTLYMFNETEDVSMLAYNHVGGSTVLNSDYDEWAIKTFCLDASEATTALVTRKEGYKYYYSPETATWMSPVIKIEFNTTATIAFASLDDMIENREVCSTVYMYIEMNTNISNENVFHVDIGSGLGTTFELVAMSVGWGNAASFSALDTQA